MNENRTLAVDIGGTFIKYGLIDPDYRVSRHHKVPTLACSSAGEFFDYLCENIPAGANIERIGISCPGLIDRNNVVRSYAAPRLHSHTIVQNFYNQPALAYTDTDGHDSPLLLL